MLLLVVLCLAATFHFDALAHAVQEDSVRNVWKILEYQTEQSKASPQFVFGVSIGVQLLIGSKQNLDPDIKQLIRQMLTIVDDFQKSCGVHDGNVYLNFVVLLLNDMTIIYHFRLLPNDD